MQKKTTPEGILNTTKFPSVLYTLIWIVFPQISALHSQELHNRAGKLRKSLEAFHHNSFRKNKISRSNRSSAFKNIKILHDHLPHLPSLWIFTITSSCQTVCSISNLLWNQSFHDKCATVSHHGSSLRNLRGRQQKVQCILRCFRCF